MSIIDDIQTNKEQLLKGFPVAHIKESDNLTYYLHINKYSEVFSKCHMYSKLKDEEMDIESAYQVVEFIQGVELGDIANNSFLLRELLCLGLKYIVYFGNSHYYIINAIAASNSSVLEDLIYKIEYRIADVPLDYPVEIMEIADLERELLKRLIQ